MTRCTSESGECAGWVFWAAPAIPTYVALHEEPAPCCALKAIDHVLDPCKLPSICKPFDIVHERVRSVILEEVV